MLKSLNDCVILAQNHFLYQTMALSFSPQLTENQKNVKDYSKKNTAQNLNNPHTNPSSVSAVLSCITAEYQNSKYIFSPSPTPFE
jgi:hypothetical protein